MTTNERTLFANIELTRVPFNLRQITRECVYFRSPDEAGRHTCRSAISETTMLHRACKLRGSVFHTTGVIAD